jgi:hypothetical protein
MKNPIKVIRETGLGIFGSIVPIPDYHAVFPDANEYDPYYLAVKHSLVNMAYIGRLSRHDRNFTSISLMHEEGDRIGRVFEIYRAMKSLTDWPDAKYLAGFSEGSKKVSGLQAADLVAREAFKHADNMGVRKMRKPVQHLADQFSFHVWTRECLEYLRDRGGPEDLSLIANWSQKGEKPPQMVHLYADSFFAYPGNKR